MRIRSLAVALALFAFGVPATANAYQTTTTASVNVRTGAGANYVRVAKLPPGASVWVDFCTKGWCAVTARGGRSGWIAARYLAGAGGDHVYRPPSAYVSPPRYVPPLVIQRGHYHDYGYSKQHEFQRKFHRKWKSGAKRWEKHAGRKWKHHDRKSSGPRKGRDGGKLVCPDGMCRL